MKESKQILVVDDDPDIRIMIKMMLEYNGYAVEVTDKGDTSEELIRSGRFHLTIMDMLLSGMSGVDICARLKQDQSIKPIPIIMISAHPNAKKMCIDAGADAFIAKPFDMQELLGMLERHL